jgi:hypothetical protein
MIMPTAPDGLLTAKYWEDRAEEARRRADQMHDRDAQQTMLGIAEVYERMSARAAAREARRPK